jgi:hypothetical protein
MSPGVVVFTVVLVILLLGWSMGINLIFSSYIYEYRNYLVSVHTLTQGLFGQREEFSNFI